MEEAGRMREGEKEGVRRKSTSVVLPRGRISRGRYKEF